MKKIFLMVALVMATLSASAQSYRGFFDFYGGIGTGKDAKISHNGLELNKIKLDYAFGISTTHGCQILPYLYAGLGAGAYTALSGVDTYYMNYDGPSSHIGDNDRSIEFYGLYVPVFLDLRWDLNIRKTVTPFVGVKIGYQFAIDIDKDASKGESDKYTSNAGGDQNTSEHLYLYSSPESGFYLMPTVGLRFRMGARSGFNLGVSYLPAIHRTISANYSRESWGASGEGSELKTVYDGKHKGGAWMLNLGFDF